MDYIARVSTEGCSPTVEQVNAYASNPFRSGLLNFLSGEITKTLIVDWLHEVGWIAISEDEEPTVSLTRLGQATLKALRKADSLQPTGRVVLFSGGNPFDYARFISELADLPAFTLVDPFLKKITHLEDLLEQTDCVRILVASKLTIGERSRLGIALREVPAERLDIRISSEVLHDRFVIPEGGSVFSFGTSVTGLNKHFSVLIEIPEPKSNTIRERHRVIWEEGISLRDLET